MADKLTLAELAKLLPLSPSVMHGLAKKGELSVEERDGQTYVSRDAVEAFLQRCILSIKKKEEPNSQEPDVSSEEEARRRERYIAKKTITARMVATDARVLEIGEGGVRIHHARPMRIGSEGRLLFELEGMLRTWAVRGRITWSKLSAGGYVSGIAVTDHHEVLHDAIDCFQRLGAIVRDRRSIARKKEARKRKETQREAMRITPHDEVKTAQEQARLIRNMMIALRTDPVMAQKWYRRAKYSNVHESVRGSLPTRAVERNEALAIWEALNHTVDLRAICRIIIDEQPLTPSPA